MLKNDTLLLGAGQCGVRIANEYCDMFDFDKNNVLFFNTAEDDKVKHQIIMQGDKDYDGSGRNPLVTIETIIPKNEEVIQKNVMKSIQNVNTVLLFNSIGGGSGSAINYHIMKNILVPYLKENKDKKLNIVSVVISPLKEEGNPCNSNSIAMMNMYYGLTNYASIIPIDNNVMYTKGSKTTFDNTNKTICEKVFTMLNYKYFVNNIKEGGIGSLDKKEFERILTPNNGFLVHLEINKDGFKRLEQGENLDTFKDYDIATAKSMIILFRTKKGSLVNINILNKINSMYPNQVKILSESLSETGYNSIDILANGVSIPDFYVEKAESIIQQISDLKETKKEDKKKNREKVRIGKKSLFKI